MLIAAEGRKAPATASDRHRGCDEIVDIEVLDVEGLAHLRATRAQQADNLLGDPGWESNSVLTRSAQSRPD